MGQDEPINPNEESKEEPLSLSNKHNKKITKAGKVDLYNELQNL